MSDRCPYCSGEKLLVCPDIIRKNGNVVRPYMDIWVEGDQLNIEMNHRREVTIKINFCPICGRKLSDA